MQFQPSSVSRRRALFGLAATGGSLLLGMPSFAHAAGKWTLEVLHGFSFNEGNGSVGSVVFGPAGLLYGAHASGGEGGLGTLYRWSPSDSSFAVLQHLEYATSKPASPQSGLIVGRDGALWGTSAFGGRALAGTIYTLAPDGSMTVHADFDSALGLLMPSGALVEGRPGRFYGTTDESVYRYDSRPGGKLKELYRFKPELDGRGSQSALVFGTDGLLYGSNPYNGPKKHGTLFRVGIDGSGFEVLKSLDGQWEGDSLRAPLLRASDGHFYGCATAGGAFERGVVFRLDSSGNYSVLHHFAGGDNDGAYPEGALVEGPDGALYGTTLEGGAAPQSYGTVFRMTKAGRLTVIHRFNEKGAAGATPLGALRFGPDGRLYGTDVTGGTGDYGTLFRLSPPSN